MKMLRWIVVLAVLAYTAWLAWPLLQHFAGGAAPATPEVTAPGGLVADLQNTPRSVLWAVAIVLYLISALMFAGKNGRAFIAYILAFGSNVALMLLQRPEPTIMARKMGPEAGIDPKYLLLGGLALIGVLMLAIGGARAQARSRSHFA